MIELMAIRGLNILLACIVSAPTPQPRASQPADGAPPVPLAALLPAAEVMRQFLAQLADNPAYPPEAREFVAQQHATPRDDGRPPPALDDDLAVLSPPFKAALDASAAEQHDAAALQFASLAQSDDPYIAVNAAYFAAQALIELDRIPEARAIIAAVLRRIPDAPRYTTHSADLFFLLGFAQANTMQYDAARITLDFFLEHAPDAPERFRTSATQMLTELDRRIPGRLPDVYDLMQFAQREMTMGDTDGDVTGSQDEAIRLLERLIQEAESQEQQNKGKGGGGKSSGRDKKDRSQKQNQKSMSPRERAELNPNNDPAIERHLERARRARPGEAWGKLTPREREQVLQSLQQQFPAQYRELVEQYYRQLAKEEPARN